MKLVADNRKVFVRPDLRAFACPTRMQNIEQATQDLLQRMLSSCPSCAAPGYSVVQRQKPVYHAKSAAPPSRPI